jgi:DNA invertase Pin-like site-specific DNA recombinase
MPRQADSPHVAFSYVRFSHANQSKGDSLRRQTAAAAAWCEKNHVALDTGTTLRDLGKSAYTGAHRRNADRNALALFLKLVEEGDRVRPGDYLLVENLDRLSREDEVPACHLLTGILMAGVKVVQLSPYEMLLTEKSNGWELMRAVMELSRGHGESAIKGERLGAAWGKKKDQAREWGKKGKRKRGAAPVQTTSTPAWLEVTGRRREGNHMRGGAFRLVPDRAEVVRRIFDLACNGYGLFLIVKRLKADKVKPWGAGDWSKTYLRNILTGRAALGVYQPKKDGKPEGDPVPHYYPAVPGVTEEVWKAAQNALASRKGKQGRVGEKVANLFGGLLYDARSRGKMLVMWQTKRARRRMLVPADSNDGHTPLVSFPYQVFEDAVLAKLREVKPADVTGAESESASLGRELGAVKQRLEEIEEQLTGDGGDVLTLARAAKVLEDRRNQLLERQRAAERKEAGSGGAAWAEAQGLLGVAKDEARRLRLRGLLRSLVESVWLLVVPRKTHRLAAVQFHFADGRRRDYLIHYWSAGYCREGGWEVLSSADTERLGELDIRKPKDAKALERTLLGMELPR